MIAINDYLPVLPEEKTSDLFFVLELNEMFLNSMPNIWSKLAYVQGFYYKPINFKASANMFEFMEISESIYKGVVEPSYKKTTRVYNNRAGFSRKIRGEAASSNT